MRFSEAIDLFLAEKKMSRYTKSTLNFYENTTGQLIIWLQCEKEKIRYVKQCLIETFLYKKIKLRILIHFFTQSACQLSRVHCLGVTQMIGLHGSSLQS